MNAVPALSDTATSAPGGRGAFAPVKVMDVEISEPLPIISNDQHHHGVFIVARLHGEPVGVCMLGLDQEDLTPDRLGELLWPELRETLNARFVDAGLAQACTLTGRGLEVEPAEWSFIERRMEALAAPPFISVVICTRDRIDHLE
jgi:hypothetical protein